jgi:hypothetical protein
LFDTQDSYHHAITICCIPQIGRLISVSRFKRFLYSSWFETVGGVSMPGLKPKQAVKPFRTFNKRFRNWEHCQWHWGRGEGCIITGVFGLWCLGDLRQSSMKFIVGRKPYLMDLMACKPTKRAK